MNTRPILARAATGTLEHTTITRASAELTPLAEYASGELEARLLPWNAPAEVSDDGGRTTYTEVWEPGSAVPSDRVAVYGSHRVTTDGRVERGPLIGVARNLESRGDGLYGTLALADTATAREVRELARLVGAYVSVEAAAELGAAGTTVTRTAADPAEVTGVAVILPPQRPAHAGAEVLAVRAASPTDPDPDPDDPDPDDPTDPPDTVTRAAVAELVRAEVARTGGRAPSSSGAHPLARFRTFGEYAQAAFTAPSASSGDPATIARALANQITTANPGVVPPGWVSNVYGILARPRRLITAFGSFPDPGYGTSIDYPLFTGDLNALVGVQATEKTPITSVVVSIGKGSVALTTLAGGSDISYQLIRRSSPSYREAYLRIMAAAYAVVSEKTAGAQAVAAATGTGTWDAASGADGLRAALFAASADVEAATGAPASFALASSDVFAGIGGLVGLYPGPYGTQNASGTATASTLKVEVSGLPIIPVPGLPAGTLIVSNQDAGGWVEDGPFPITAEDVELLGQNVAIWGMGGFASPVPAGIIEIAITGVLPLGSAPSSSTRGKG